MFYMSIVNATSALVADQEQLIEAIAKRLGRDDD
jgi:hypothetical protein